MAASSSKIQQDFGVAHFVLSQKRGTLTVLETRSRKNPKFVYHWSRERHDIPIDAKQQFTCTGCSMFAIKSSRSGLHCARIHAGNGRLLDDPDNPPKYPHTCKPKLYTVALADRFRTRMKVDCVKKMENANDFNLKAYYDTFVKDFHNSEELKELSKANRAAVTKAFLHNGYDRLYHSLLHRFVDPASSRPLKRHRSPQCRELKKAKMADFGPAHFASSHHADDVSVLETRSAKHPKCVYLWVRQQRTARGNRMPFTCSGCLTMLKGMKRKNGRLPAVISVLDGRLRDDPDNPEKPHVCEPRPYIDVLAKRLHARMINECWNANHDPKHVSTFYKQYIAKLGECEELRELQKEDFDAVMAKVMDSGEKKLTVCMRQRLRKFVQHKVRVLKEEPVVLQICGQKLGSDSSSSDNPDSISSFKTEPSDETEEQELLSRKQFLRKIAEFLPSDANSRTSCVEDFQVSDEKPAPELSIQLIAGVKQEE